MMNQQAMLRKARQLQQEMLKTQQEIEQTEFRSRTGPVVVVMLGNKELKSVIIDKDFKIESNDDYELLEDSILASTRKLYEEITKFTEEKMGKYKSFLGGFGGF